MDVAENPSARIERLRAELADAERAERRENLEKLGQELSELLKRYEARLVAEIQIIGTEIRSTVRIVTK
jgi:hypothetical protein